MIKKEQIQELAKALYPEIQAIREHIHTYPELSFQEYETSAYVKGVLELHGIPYTGGYVKTGIVAEIKGSSDGPIIALRADLDALPILEKNDVSYRSKNEGVMHACGHDVHTACALGAAIILHQTRAEWGGTVKILFQPGEELLPGGASLMIKEGVLSAPQVTAITAQHVYPSMECGKVGFRKGMYMASTDEIYLTVKGKGGHGAMPHQNIDPVLATAHILIALQQISSRYAPPIIPTVLSFGKVQANGVTNVIPDEVKLEGTFRTMNEDWRNRAHDWIRKIAKETAASFGATCDVQIERGYPFLVNHPELTGILWQAAEQYLGKENVEELEMRMTAEDFAYYSQEVPACFYRLGTGNKSKGIVSGVHTSTFDIDERALEIGAGLMAWLSICQLNQKQ